LHNISVSYRIANSALRRFQRPPPARASAANLPSGPHQKTGWKTPLTQSYCPFSEQAGGGPNPASLLTSAGRVGNPEPDIRARTASHTCCASRARIANEFGPIEAPVPEAYPVPGWASQVCQNPRDEFWHSSWRDSGSAHAARACRKEIHRAAGHESFDSAWPDGMAAPSLGRE